MDIILVTKNEVYFHGNGTSIAMVDLELRIHLIYAGNAGGLDPYRSIIFVFLHAEQRIIGSQRLA
jgi:hypothetical protein